MFLILRWLINALTLFGITYLVSGIEVKSFYIALVTALILGLVNAIIRPIIKIFTLPITILTLGLFSLVINALLFWLVSTFIQGFEVADFKAAFWGALIMSIVSWLVSFFLKR